METKKHHTKDLEKKRFLFFQIGLIAALFFTIIAFEWRSPYTFKKFDKPIAITDNVWDLPPLLLEKKVELPKPKDIQKAVKFSTEIQVVDKTTDETAEPVDDPKPAKTLDFKPEILDETDITVNFPDVEPEFIGGEKALFQFLKKHVKYPEMQRVTGIQGTVHVTFVVGKDGKIRDIEIMRGIKGLDEEAIRVIKMMPDWKPGIQKGRPVSARFNLPIRFKLEK